MAREGLQGGLGTGSASTYNEHLVFGTNISRRQGFRSKSRAPSCCTILTKPKPKQNLSSFTSKSTEGILAGALEPETSNEPQNQPQASQPEIPELIASLCGSWFW